MPRSHTSIPLLTDAMTADAAANEASRARAADLVETFVRGEAATALDSVLDAAQGDRPMDPARAEAAAEVSALIDEEVQRFRALSNGS